MLSLFSFLHRYDHEYHVWYDDKFSFWWDKSTDLVMERIESGISFLKDKWVDVFIVPPIVELKIANEGLFSSIKILPLFQNYVFKNCFAYSLVGKIGFFGDYFDLQEWQQQLKILANNYKLSDNQNNIKKFHFPFSFWSKEVKIWKYLLDMFSWSAPLVNNTVKQDLRYFKDAGVDTIIPCNYSYFLAQKTIKKVVYTNMRFYWLDVLEKIFVDLVDYANSTYSINIYSTWHAESLKKNKKMKRLLMRWNKIEIIYKNI